MRSEAFANEPDHHLRPSTSRTSLDDLAREDEVKRGQEKRRDGDKVSREGRGSARPVHIERTRTPSASKRKGKERAVEVELAIIGADGVRRTIERTSFEAPSETEVDTHSVPPRGGALDLGAAGENRLLHSTSASPRPPPVPLPPPPVESPPRPQRLPLQSILKRPQPARTPSSVPSHLSFSTSLSPLPSSPTITTSGLPVTDGAAPSSPGLASADSPDWHEKSHVLFSTPGTNSTVLPLSTPSIAGGGYASSEAPSTARSRVFDPTSTMRSWKSSIMGRKSKNFDKKRLASMGYEEELNRDYDFWASWGISMCNIGALPGVTLGVLTAFKTGGGSMYSILWPISGIFMTCVAAALGEMASTWPVAGASFTWVFRLCRSRKSLDPWARYLSWVTGSLLLCAHLLLQIVVTWQFAHNLLGVVTLFTDTQYSFWVTVSICWAICLLSAAIVSSRLSRSPWLWRACGGLVVVFFFTIVITLLVHAERIQSAKFVFTSYSNDTGFESRSYVTLIGWCLTCVATGMEASAHMAEDTIRPSRTVPKAMFWSVVASYGGGWVLICVLLATMNTEGLDPDLQPSIALLANSIPRRYAILILVFVLLSFLFQTCAQLLATSRYIWSLARESALPFSTFFRGLSKRHRQPSAAIWVTVGIAAPTLLLLSINTSIIATTLLEGAGISATTAYLAPILLYLVCPNDVLRGDGRAQFTLRKASKPLAMFAALFLLMFISTMCLPTGYPITTLTVSYASVVFVGVVLLSSAAWVLYGNRHYAGPIRTTTRWTIGAEVDLPSSSSQGDAPRKKTTAAIGATTSAAHGRSAHVFATSDAGDESSTPRATAEMERTRGTELSGVSGVTSASGSDWSGSYTDDTDGSYTDEDDEDETDEEEDGRRDSRRRSAADEEAGVPPPVGSQSVPSV